MVRIRFQDQSVEDFYEADGWVVEEGWVRIRKRVGEEWETLAVVRSDGIKFITKG